MKIAKFTNEETLRVKDLQSYNILDSELEIEYDNLVELASQICDCPIGLITFVDNERQWFKAKKNLEESETKRDIAFCSHTILQNEVMIVADAKSDERFFDNPLVTGEMQIGFYAGAPIVSSAGYNLGSVCVIDHTKKKGLSVKQQNGLKIIAQQISKLLELRGKNKLIIKQSEFQIEAEKRISQLIVAESDNKDSLIAYELHENLAQSLASVKLFLETAENSKDLQSHFLMKSIEVITLLIEDVKILSKSIIPTTFQNADYYWIICEFANQFGKENNIEITFGVPTIIKSNASNIGLNLFKIVQKQLEISKISNAKKIFISIKSNIKITLNFSYDTHLSKTNISLSHLINNITTRVELLNGTLTQKATSKENSLMITLPL